MAFIAPLLVIVFVPAVIGTSSYMGGRILLPEMGLEVPGWWAWYWASMAVTVAGAILGGIKELFSNA